MPEKLQELPRRAGLLLGGDLGDGDWLDALTLRAGLTAVRLFPDVELEAKFTPDASLPTEVGGLLRSLRSHPALPPHLLFADWESRSSLRPEYWVDGDVEYSQFVYDGRPMLKRKCHRVVSAPGRAASLMEAEETFEYDAAALDPALPRGAVHIGSLVKERCKTYLVNLSQNVVYSVAETLCSAGGTSQSQVEIEYRCHLLEPEAPHAAAVAIQDLHNLLWDTVESLSGPLGQIGLVSTAERKQDFLVHSRSDAVPTVNGATP